MYLKLLDFYIEYKKVQYTVQSEFTTLLFAAVNLPVNFPPVGMPFTTRHIILMIRTHECHIVWLAENAKKIRR